MFRTRLAHIEKTHYRLRLDVFGEGGCDATVDSKIETI